MNLEDRLDKLRITRGWGWKDVELALGIGRTMLHYIRTGERQIGEVELYKLEKLEVESGITSERTVAEVREAEAAIKELDMWRERAIAAETKLAALFSLPEPQRRAVEALINSLIESGKSQTSSGRIADIADNAVHEISGKVRARGPTSRGTQAHQQEAHTVQSKGHPPRGQH